MQSSGTFVLTLKKTERLQNCTELGSLQTVLQFQIEPFPFSFIMMKDIEPFPFSLIYFSIFLKWLVLRTKSSRRLQLVALATSEDWH